MKATVFLFAVIVVGAALLWLYSAPVTDQASSNGPFVSLYSAAQAARAHQPLYEGQAASGGETAPEGTPQTPGAAPSEPSAAPEPASSSAPAGDPPQNGPSGINAPTSVNGEAGASAAAVSTDAGVAAGEKAAEPPAAEAAAQAAVLPEPFKYPPYVSLIFLPLTFAGSVKTAALAWYWTNVALLIIVMFDSTYVLSGSTGSGENALFLVPLTAAAPLVYFFLPGLGLTLLAILFVLAGLSMFRRSYDFVAGLVTSLALFSPFGAAFTIYYLLKRSWLAIAGVAVGAIFLYGVVPMVYFGPQAALNQIDAYRTTVLARLPAEMTSPDALKAPDNYSMWAVIERHLGEINKLGGQAASLGEKYQMNLGQVTSNWDLVVFIVLGIIVTLATLVGLFRKLTDRSIPLVGLEGALVVLATLVLAPRTSLAAMVALIVALFAAVYVIRYTDVRRIVHHANYVALIFAAALFYLALDERFRTAGSVFGGAFVLWVATLWAINRFRPHLMRRGAPGPAVSATTLEKPIELAKARPREAGKPKEEKPGGEEKPKKGIIPMPGWLTGKPAAPEGVAEEPKPEAAKPIELGDKPETAKPIELGDKPEDKGKDDKKITLE